jgi:N-acetylglucosaminyldiphosphoundecaprenol N-acetyl-beta-D-mannosaminyltransferase
MSNSSAQTPRPLPDPKSVVILGVPFHDVTMAETLTHIDQLVAARRPRYLATANLDFAAQASRDVELQRILLEAHLVLCDGTPLIWASRWLDAPLRERVAGSDLIPVLAAHCAQRGHRLFLLGATDETLAAAKRRLEAAHPGLIICGTFAPPIAPLLDFDHEAILERLRAARPDILLVAFGCPKQEKWIYMNLLRLPVPVSIGVGASLDFVAGNFRRAPHWMRAAGLEWVVRLLQEPRRLFNRYLFDLFFFVRALRRQRAALRQAGAMPPPPPPTAEEAPVVRDHRLLPWSGRADAAAVAAGRLPAPLPEEGIRSVILDLSGVTFMDSTGLGLVLKGFRSCKQAGGGFALLRPPPAVRTLLAAMNLDRLVPMADTITQARTACGLTGGRGAGETAPDALTLACDGDLVVGRTPGIRRWLESAWEAKREATRLVLDLSRVNFIDSSGLGLLVAARKLAHVRPGGTLELRGANDNVRNVIALARMTEFLGLAPAKQ